MALCFTGQTLGFLLSANTVAWYNKRKTHISVTEYNTYLLVVGVGVGRNKERRFQKSRTFYACRCQKTGCHNAAWLCREIPIVETFQDICYRLEHGLQNNTQKWIVVKVFIEANKSMCYRRVDRLYYENRSFEVAVMK